MFLVRFASEISGLLPSLRQKKSYPLRFRMSSISPAALARVVSTYRTLASVCMTARPVISA